MNILDFELESTAYSISVTAEDEFTVLINNSIQVPCKLYFPYLEISSLASTLNNLLFEENLSATLTKTELILSQIKGTILFNEFLGVQCSVCWDPNGYFAYILFPNGERKVFEARTSIPHIFPYELRMKIQELYIKDELDILLEEGALILTTKLEGIAISAIREIEAILTNSSAIPREVQEEQKIEKNSNNANEIPIQIEEAEKVSEELQVLTNQEIIASVVTDYSNKLSKIGGLALQKLNSEGGSLMMKITKPSMTFTRGGLLKSSKEGDIEVNFKSKDAILAEASSQVELKKLELEKENEVIVEQNKALISKECDIIELRKTKLNKELESEKYSAKAKEETEKGEIEIFYSSKIAKQNELMKNRKETKASETAKRIAELQNLVSMAKIEKQNRLDKLNESQLSLEESLKLEVVSVHKNTSRQLNELDELKQNKTREVEARIKSNNEIIEFNKQEKIRLENERKRLELEAENRRKQLEAELRRKQEEYRLQVEREFQIRMQQLAEHQARINREIEEERRRQQARINSCQSSGSSCTLF